MTERRWKVAQLRPQPEAVEVMFYESARIYRLWRANPDFEAALRTLQSAKASGDAVSVTLSKQDEEIIETVRP